MKILGIETSCDECAAAMVEDGRTPLSHVVSSQVEVHAPFGGVVPEIASRRHLETILPVIDEALTVAKVTAQDVDAVAVTNRPGLIGALLVGLSAAKGLALAAKKPLIPVDHIAAHVYASVMDRSNPSFPLTGLVVSGGHTSLYHVRSILDMERIGATLDDAAGEAFDKVAAILGLGYPGGPAIEGAAGSRKQGSVNFPRSLPGGDQWNFSFSGLKTAVLYYCRGVPKKGRERTREQEEAARRFDPSDPDRVADVAASFQAAVVDVLVERTFHAAKAMRSGGVALGGGVAANTLLRDRMTEEADRHGIPLYLASRELATDNAVMVAGLAYHLYRAGRIGGLDTDAYPR